MSKSTRCKVALGVICFYAVATLVARRRGYSGMGGRTLVQCRQGHLFRTIWVPGVSIKALRLGWYRAQFCPVGRHWTLVKPVRDRDVEGRDEALEVIPEDIAIP
jgi:hypothetical protein